MLVWFDVDRRPGSILSGSAFKLSRNYFSQGACGYDSPCVFIGVLSSPAENERRSYFRANCAREWQKAMDDGLLRWRFFVGEPEGRNDANQLLATTAGGAKVSAQAHQSALELLNESTIHNDIEVGPYGDHYTTIHRKVFHIFREGSKAEKDWDPAFVVKMDIDMCFSYDKFRDGWRDYMRIYRGHELSRRARQGKRQKNQRAKLEFVYRPSLKGYNTTAKGHRRVRNTSDRKPIDLANTPNLYTNFFSQHFGDNYDHSKVYAKHTDFSHPIMAVFSLNIFSVAVYKIQYGFHDTFEQYPSGPCYVVSADLARIFVSSQDRAHTILTPETSGSTSEDVNVGYWMSRNADANQLQIDMVSINGNFARDVKGVNTNNISGQADDTIRIKSATPLCLSAEQLQVGRIIRLAKCKATANEQFVLENGDSTIRVKANLELCLGGPVDGQLKSGNVLALRKCTAAPNQQFVFNNRDNTIRPKSDPKLCFDGDTGRLEVGDKLILYSCSASPHEQFNIEVSKNKPDQPLVFIGILSSPEEVRDRLHFRNGCAKNWTRSADEGFLRWRFFIGELEGKLDTHSTLKKVAKASEGTHEASLKLLNESAVYKDIEFGTTIHQKVFHILQTGSLNQSGWYPDFIIKQDIDKCFDYESFAQGVREYKQIYRDSQLRDSERLTASARLTSHRERLRFPHVELLYRSPVGSADSTKTNRSLESPVMYTNIVRTSIGSSVDPSIQYANHTNFSRPIMPVFGKLWWTRPKYSSQLGFNGTFEPYPSGPCYAFPADLARNVVGPENRASTILTMEASGSTSEDVNIGYWLSHAADAGQLQIDLVTIKNICSDVVVPWKNN